MGREVERKRSGGVKVKCRRKKEVVDKKVRVKGI